jgi:hypothetical protein
MGLKHRGACTTHTPCCGCLTPCHHMHDIAAAARFPVRNRTLRSTLEAATRDSTEAVRLYVKQHGLDAACIIEPNPDLVTRAKAFANQLWDATSDHYGGSSYDVFPWTVGAYVAVGANPDILHVVDIGIGKRGLTQSAWYYDQNRSLCFKRTDGCTELNRRLKEHAPHDGELHHVHGGLFTSKTKDGSKKVKLKAGLMGCEVAAVVPHMIYATRDVRPLSDFWRRFCVWRDSLKAGVHSFASVVAMYRSALA